MEGSKIKDVVAYLESFAPSAYQESYDNAGLLVGDLNREVTGILVTLDCTEKVVMEAVERKCNLIVAHHPIVFKGLKKLTGRTYVERVVISAIRNDVAIFASHTNLDNVRLGVNKKIAEKLDLKNIRILAPRKDTLSKLVTFIPNESLEKVMNAVHEAGAGQIGEYKNCSFRVAGIGTFLPTEMAHPTIGTAGKQEKVNEVRVEVIFPTALERQIVSALKESHPYEEVSYYINRVENENQEVGAGMVGELPAPEEPIDFLKRLKSRMNVSVVKHTVPAAGSIRKVALCGGAGSFLLGEAIASGADVYISSDFKYHEFFDAEGRIMIADVGHYESEQFTKELFGEILTKKFTTFAINFSKTVTNPISYL
ncbi:MAG TPA: Nif3-like dinuclear metal center hexameric protein [Cyclobacteriaceae bacterium]|nr:Nif3-like dinuclear metal center hexameric protein [Cyclobacteriaceae bacterium]